MIMMNWQANKLRSFLRHIVEGDEINPYAVAFILTERMFRGPFFRMGELLYSAISTLVFRVEPRITVGHCQVSFAYWRGHYGNDTFLLLLGTLSLRESYKVCCTYLRENQRSSLSEVLVSYNGRPSKLYVQRFMQNIHLVNESITMMRMVALMDPEYEDLSRL
jgi:hypothetical protein